MQLIEKYLDKTLSAKEQIEFEKNLKDPEFKEQLLFQAKLVDSLEQNASEPLQISGVGQDASIPLSSLVIRLAAAVLMIFAVLFVLKNFTGSPETKLYSEFYAAYPANTARGHSNTNDREEFNIAMSDYADKKYQIALDRLQAIPEQNEEQALYIANCLMELGEDKEALKLFGGMGKSINTKYRWNAEWYSFLILLKNKDETSKTYLNKILSNPKHLYFGQAKAIENLIN